VRDNLTNTELLRLLYDARGRAVAIRESGQVMHLMNDGPSVVEEYIGSTVSRQYVYESGIDGRCQVAAGGEEWWCHCDPQGSLRLLTNAAGQVPPDARYEYAPFGLLTRGTAGSTPYLFAGKRLLATIGVYDSRARQYSASLGRFLQRDPKGYIEGPNPYAYCANNPATFVDPLGEERTAAEPPVTPPPLTAAEQAAFDAAERAGYDAESVEKLIQTYAEPVGTREGLSRNTMERYATVRGTAFSKQWDQGNYATAAGHLVVGLVEGVGSSFGGNDAFGTAINAVMAGILGKLIGGLRGLAGARYNALINRPAYVSDTVIRPSPATPLDREGAAVWSDLLSQQWADVLTENLGRNGRPTVAGVSIDVTTGQIRYGTSGEGRGGMITRPPGRRLLPHPDTPVLPVSLVAEPGGSGRLIAVNQCAEFALQDKIRWAGASIENQIMSVRETRALNPATNVHALRRACNNCQVTSNGAYFTGGVEPPP
jgi:RHS repeat-associated protein